MNPFTFSLRLFIAFAVCTYLLPSCASRDGSSGLITKFEDSPLASVAVPLGQIGLAYALNSQQIEPGDFITITKGLAIIRSEGSGDEKILSLQQLGIEELVKRGDLKEGDMLLIEELNALLKRPPVAEPLPDAKAPVDVSSASPIKVQNATQWVNAIHYIENAPTVQFRETPYETTDEHAYVYGPEETIVLKPSDIGL